MYQKSVFFLIAILLTSYFLFGQPTFTSFSPASGAIGTTVTINGNNFSDVSSNNIVFFGAVRANVLSATVSKLTVAVPVSATFDPISVTVNGRTGYSNKPFVVTFQGGGGIDNQSFPDVLGADTLSGPDYGRTKGLAVADFDGDGKPDFAVVDNVYNSLSVYRNTSARDSVTFAPRILYAADSSATAVTAGDIDGDGKPDLIVANSLLSVSNIFVYRNTSSPGHISFATPTAFAAGTQPGAVCVADFDRDGKPDIAIANVDLPGSITILRNISLPGTIMFGSKWTTPLAETAAINDIKSADIDSDGRLDILAIDLTTGALLVLRNASTSGNLFFNDPVRFSTGYYTYALATGDLDNDGNTDVVVANSASNNISLFRNTSSPGAISFANRIDMGSLKNADDVTITDLDGDGKLDLAILGESTYIFKNYSAPGTLYFASRVDRPADLWKIGSADFDGDGRNDLIESGGAYRAYIFPNHIGNPQVTSFSPVVAGNGTTVTITGSDFTGTSSVSFGGVPVLSFTVVNPTTITAVVGAGASGDVKVTNVWGSGSRAGFAFSSVPVISSFSPALGTAGTTITINGANFTTATGVSFGGTSASSYTIVSPSLITAVVGNGTSGDISVFFPSTVVTAPGFIYTKAPVVYSFSPLNAMVGSSVSIDGANFSSNADSNIFYFGAVRAKVLNATATHMEVVVPVGACYNPLSVTVNRLTGFSPVAFDPKFAFIEDLNSNSFSAKTQYKVPGAVYGIDAADLDGDGKTDIVTPAYDSARICISANNSTLGRLSFTPIVDTVTHAYCQGIALVDVDGDGMKDIASNGFLQILKNRSVAGKLNFEGPVNVSAGLEHVAFADFDGDGSTDLVVTNSGVTVVKNTSVAGNLSFQIVQDKMPAGIGPRGPSVADFDGDGKPDIVVANQESNSMSVFRNTCSAASFSFAPMQDFKTGYQPRGTAIGDLNGDGKNDIIVSNEGGGSISIFKNTSIPGSISFEPMIELPTAGHPRGIALGDLNGDGLPDIVSVNSLSGSVSVFVNQSTGNSIAFRTSINYTAGTFPQYVSIADLDGDQKPDLALSDYGGNVVILKNQVGEQTVYACEGSDTTLTVAKTGTLFQWQINTGSGFSSLTNNSIYSGVNTSSLKITLPALSLNNAQYRCIVDGNYSKVFNLVVTSYPPTPVITATNTTVCYWNWANLRSSSPTGNQWYNNGIAVPDATSQVYNPNGDINHRPMSFTVVSTIDGCASKPSSPVIVNTLQEVTPSILVSYSGCESDSLILTSTISNGGTNPSINWYEILNYSTQVGTGAKCTIRKPANGTVIYAELSSDATCASPQKVSSKLTTINCVATALPQIEGLEVFKVAPNPTNGLVTVQIKTIKRRQVLFEVFNNLGNRVYSSGSTMVMGQVNKEIDLRDKPQGLYVLRATLNNKSIVEKIVVCRN